MENETFDHKQRQLISSFINITACQNEEIAIHFLEATMWKLDDAINLFLISYHQSPCCQDAFMCPTSVAVCPEDVWDDSTPEKPSDSRLSSLYRPPLDLLFNGSFEEAKSTSSREDLWLLVNLQSTTEFASHTLNRDVWSNDAVSQAIGGMIEAHGFLEDLMKYRDVGPHEHVASLTSNKRIKTEKICFESSQADDDHHGMSTFWEDDRFVTPPPSWGIEFEETCLSSDDMFEFPVLTEEPKGDCDRSLLCSLCIRFPDGRRMQRKFLKSEPIQLLWSFCYSNMEESEKRAFKLVQAIPGATKTLDYGAKATFDQSGIDNSIVSVTWE
ncbi:PREDICTED: putative plant UBX domain-containing protein 14 [Camelina sativa]|uniref:Plant UBX domain-containing protein 14 n=1 Tax=Camelina sativa TaxID=90675 RepID=A0ABM0U6F2_CAMSA|nr:PREDICTED: putative plant UBX domain-containing protein 14 [Camelina sativa]